MEIATTFFFQKKTDINLGEKLLNSFNLETF